MLKRRNVNFEPESPLVESNKQVGVHSIMLLVSPPTTPVMLHLWSLLYCSGSMFFASCV